MKYTKFYLIWTLLTLNVVQARPGVETVAAPKRNRLLVCLALEEAKIHQRRDTGAQYRLNQLFINEITQFSDVPAKDDAFERVCKEDVFSPSVYLLRELLLNRDGVFDLNAQFGNTQAGLRQFKIGLVKELLNQIPHIFFRYLGDLNREAPGHDCLQKHIPEISYFLERYHYLESDLGVDQLLADKEKIKNIFEKLKDFKGILLKCK